MPSYKVAHLREQGQDMIIVPLEAHFGNATAEEQEGFVEELQVRANAAGMRGTVAAVGAAGSSPRNRGIRSSGASRFRR